MGSGTKYETTVQSIPSTPYKSIMRLRIRNIHPQDFTSYSCQAKNSMGETKGTIYLYEGSSPPSPTVTGVTDRTPSSSSNSWGESESSSSSSGSESKRNKHFSSKGSAYNTGSKLIVEFFFPPRCCHPSWFFRLDSPSSFSCPTETFFSQKRPLHLYDFFTHMNLLFWCPLFFFYHFTTGKSNKDLVGSNKNSGHSRTEGTRESEEKSTLTSLPKRSTVSSSPSVGGSLLRLVMLCHTFCFLLHLSDVFQSSSLNTSFSRWFHTLCDNKITSLMLRFLQVTDFPYLSCSQSKCKGSCDVCS